MNKLDIIKSYLKDLPTEEEWFKHRISKCLECPYNTKNGAELKKLSHKMVEKTLADKEYGQCSLCGCPTEKKCSVLSSSCEDTPKRWNSLELVGKGSITDYLKINAIKNIKEIEKKSGSFIFEAIDVENHLYIEFEVETSFNGNFVRFTAGCPSCTKGDVTSLGGNKYLVKIRIQKEELGYHRSSFSITFNRDGMAGKAALITLSGQINFNKIKKDVE